VLNKQIIKIKVFSSTAFPPLFLPGTKPPGMKNSSLSEPGGTRLRTTGLDIIPAKNSSNNKKCATPVARMNYGVLWQNAKRS